MAKEIAVGGITVPLTHPDKVLFPDNGITKEDLARYYADIADWMLPWLRDRPITMVRYPDGLGGQQFSRRTRLRTSLTGSAASKWKRRAARSSTSSATSPPPSFT